MTKFKPQLQPVVKYIVVYKGKYLASIRYFTANQAHAKMYDTFNGARAGITQAVKASCIRGKQTLLLDNFQIYECEFTPCIVKECLPAKPDKLEASTIASASLRGIEVK